MYISCRINRKNSTNFCLQWISVYCAKLLGRFRYLLTLIHAYIGHRGRCFGALGYYSGVRNKGVQFTVNHIMMRYTSKLAIFNLMNVEIGKQDVISIIYMCSFWSSMLLRKCSVLLLWQRQQNVVLWKYIPVGISVL
jgi:hypothetical protein